MPRSEHLRILICGINYAPELIGVGKFTGELAEWLVTHGHEVSVVTAPPYYPAWQVEGAYSPWRYKRERRAGVTLWRCPVWVPARPTGLRRLLHLASFAISSFPVMLLRIASRPDVVIAIEPPLFCAPAAWLVGRLARAKCWLHIQDFEIDAGFELGLLRRPWIRRTVMALERWLMRRFDTVSTISEAMLNRLADKGVDAPKRELFPNWVDTRRIYPLEHTSPLRREYGIPGQATVVLYSGNMGQKQGLELVVNAARITAGQDDIVYVLCGGGSAYRRLRSSAEGLPNVRWLPLQSAGRLNLLLNLADIHVLPQRAEIADLVMPSKLSGMMASGRPVVACTQRGTQLARLIEGCGVCVPPGDASALAVALCSLARDRERCEKLGWRARARAREYFSKISIMDGFERQLSLLMEREHARGIANRVIEEGAID
jgi:colanic acid biosynthesis glycosyl transferase WcaI